MIWIPILNYEQDSNPGYSFSEEGKRNSFINPHTWVDNKLDGEAQLLAPRTWMSTRMQPALAADMQHHQSMHPFITQLRSDWAIEVAHVA